MHLLHFRHECGIGHHKVRPVRRDGSQATVLVVIVGSVLPPVLAPGNEFVLTTGQRMERMRDSETSWRIVPIASS